MLLYDAVPVSQCTLTRLGRTARTTIRIGRGSDGPPSEGLRALHEVDRIRAGEPCLRTTSPFLQYMRCLSFSGLNASPNERESRQTQDLLTVMMWTWGAADFRVAPLSSSTEAASPPRVI